jgi:cyclophilin family peptidyl-prolyl cis-trans isomerase
VPSRSRQRHLAKLAARRQAERRRRRRNRLVAAGLALALILGGGGAVAAVLLSGSSTPKALPSSTPTPSATTTPPVTVACGGTTLPAASTVARFNGKYPKPPRMTIKASKRYLWTLETSCGTIQIALDPKEAPNTVNSIVFLTKQGLYDGVTFHRIVPNFVIQGGDPLGTGTGGPGYTTLDAPPAKAKYPVGTIAMAKAQTEPAGTAGSQFFIVTSSSAQTALAPSGKPQYAIVGKVVKGMAVVSTIAAVPVGGQTGDVPQQNVYIVKATITVKK